MGTTTTPLQPAPDWAAWSQGGYLPPADDTSNSGFMAFLANAPSSVRAQLAGNLSALGAQPHLPPSGAALSGTQTPPTIGDFIPPTLGGSGHPLAAAGDALAGANQTGGSFTSPTDAPPSMAPAPAPQAAPQAPQPNDQTAADAAASDAARKNAGVPGGIFTAAQAAPATPVTAAITPASGDPYASASAPSDPAMAQTVRAAAAKYGVPEWVANWVGTRESGFRDQPANQYGAEGPWQFKPGTAQQYGLSNVHDFASSTDAAMRLLADNYRKTGSWAGAINAYGTFSSGMGPERDAALKNGFAQYASQFGNGAAPPGAPTAPQAPVTVAQMDAGQPPSGQLGNDPNDPLSFISRARAALPYNEAQLQLPGGSKLLALASGILSGHSLGQGLGKGFANLSQMQMQDIANRRAINAQVLQLANVGLMGNYRNAMLGIRQQTADNGSDRVKVAQQALSARLNPTVQSQLASAHESGKDSAEDITSIMGSAPADQQAMHEIDQARQLNTQRPDLVGPTLANRWNRFAAEVGLTGDAADLNALQKMTTDQRNVALTSLTNGHVGGIRSNQELQNLTKAFPDVGTSPAANDYILRLMGAQLGAKQAYRQHLSELYQSDPEKLAGSAYQFQKQKFYQDYYDANKLPDYQSPTGGTAAAPAVAAPATPSAPGGTTSSGVKWSLSP